MPFGGATFRHIRTYSEHPAPGYHELQCATGDYSNSADAYWDWHGQGWMMGEAPIFLLHANHQSITNHEYSGTGQYGLATDPGDPEYFVEPPRCYLVLDAHHSIPFIAQKQGDNPPKYVAPPQFDAQVTLSGGTWDPVKFDWSAPPQDVTVWTNDGTVKYTFKMMVGDVYAQGTWHTRPAGNIATPHGPFGLPYWGRLERIEDRFGNKVLLDYCEFRQFDPPDMDPNVPLEEDCLPCHQNCNERGSPTRARLVAAGGDTEWTIFYTYRSFFWDFNPWQGTGYSYETHQQNSIHAIYVYAGLVNYPEGLTQNCMTLPSSLFDYDPEETPREVYEKMDAVDAEDYFNLSPDWKLKSLYTYSNNDAGYPTINEYTRVFDKACPNPSGSPRLLKVATTNTQHTAQAPMQTTYHVYRYKDTQNQGWIQHSNDWASLYLAYGPSAVANILNSYRLREIHPIGAIPAPYSVDVYDLLLWEDNHPVQMRDPETGDLLDPSPILRQLADMQFYSWDQTLSPPSGSGSGPLTGEASSFHTTDVMGTLRTDYLDGIDKDRLVFLPAGVFLGVNSEEGSRRTHRVYRFLVHPGTGWDENPEFALDPVPNGEHCYNAADFFPRLYRALYHHPYRIVTDGYRDTPNQLEATTQTNLDEPFWIAVVDTYDNFDDSFLNSTTISLPAAQNPDSRRVVQLNAKGFVVKETVWNKEGELLSTSGLTESRKYDEWGRLKEIRSKGWAVADIFAQGDDAGLINVFWYDDQGLPSNPDPWQPNSNVKIQADGTGVKKGVDGDVHWLSRNKTFTQGDWEVQQSIAYVNDVSAVLDPVPPAPGDTTTAEMVWVDTRSHVVPDSGLSWAERRRDRKVVIKPGSSARPSGPTLYAVEREVLDEKGRMIARGYGMLEDSTGASSTGSDDQFYWDTTEYDDLGRPLVEVTDDYDGFDDDLAPQLDRNADSSALDYVTQYEYYPPEAWQEGIKRVAYPNGREQYVLYNMISNNNLHFEQRIYQDVVSVSGGGKKCLQPVQVNEVAMGQVVRSRAVNIALSGVPTGTETFAEQDVVSTLLPNYDDSGQLVQASRKGTDGSKVESLIEMDGFGNVIRQIDADKTVTRFEYDHLGFQRRTWRGTSDSGDYWDTGGTSDNMVLTQKVEYGDASTTAGITNAHLVTKVRTLRDQPTDRYEDTTNEDTLGWVEEYGYDWSMRQVVTIRRNKTGTIVSQTATYADPQGRVRLVAEYGSSMPTSSSLDPRLFVPGQTLPTAADLLTASPVPLRLSETLYHASGQASDVRTYDVSSGSAAEYTSSQTYYDYGDRVVYAKRTNGGIQRSSFDARGRRYVSTTEVMRTSGTPTEMVRVDTVYDVAGNALEVKRHERYDDGSLTGALVPAGQSGVNSIMTRTFNWYDEKNRLIATADIGTDSSSKFANASGGATRPSTAPLTYSSGVLTGVSAISNAPNAKVTGYQYDSESRLSRVVHPNGSITLNKYDDLGQLLLSIDNAAPTGSQTSASDRIATGYKYELGRLTMMATIKDFNDLDTWSALTYSNGDAQVSKVEYGAVVVYETSTESTSLNNSFISKLYLPDPTTGKPSTTAAFEYKYYPDGKLAERKDGRGIKIKHKYDEWGRLTEVLVDQASWKATFPTNWRFPVDQMERITYTYNALGQLTLVNTAWFNSHPSVNNWQTITENKLTYDPRGNLIKEEQEHGGAVNASTPLVEYAWAFSKAGTGGFNFDRLTDMTYPDRNQNAGVQRRVVSFSYGASTDDPNSLMNRVTKIADVLSTAPTVSTTRAEYTYTGVGRRLSEILGANSAGTSWASRWLADSDASVATGFERLDPMGRMKDLHFERPGTSTIHQYQYTFDLSDNLKTAKAKQAATGGGYTDNKRSYGYAYDNLNRLKEAQMGELDSGLAIVAPSGGEIRKTGWGLDQLGNWVGASSPLPTVGKFVEGLDGNPSTVDTLSIDHSVDELNKLAQTTTITNGGSPVTVSHVFDANGNLVSDGMYYYEYDAFNRLVQVRLLGSLTFNSAGIPQANNSGYWVVHYAYDGVSRIARRQAPWPQAGTTSQKRMEHYYYDGARRIQEVFTDPFDSEEEEAESMADENVANPTPNSIRYTNREYIYGTGDRHGLDEFICQLTSLNAPAYILQDVSGNVMGLLEADGDVIEQHTYDPYGDIIASESFLTYAINRLGHKGLFFDRLDSAVAGSQMVPSAVGHYLNRNRMYAPRFGRWLQRDPNETGQIVAASAMLGAIAQSGGGEWADMKGMYGDGMSLYNYLGNNPLTRSDPMGLTWDPFEMVDEFTAEHSASVAAFMERINGGFNAALHIALQIAQMHPAIGTAVALYNISQGNGDVYDLLELATGPVGKVIGKAIGSYGKVSRAYEATGKTCRLGKRNSFVEHTMVMTVIGERPIEELRQGDLVLTRLENDPCSEPMFRPIIEVIVGEARSIVWITTEDGRSIGITADHEVWVELEQGRAVWRAEIAGDLNGGWVEARDLRIGDELRGPASDATGRVPERVRIASMRFEPRTARVYNLQVEQGRTYFANGLWVHNCGPRIGPHDIINVERLPSGNLSKAPSKRGNAPIGKDGKPVNIHHEGQNPEGPFREILSTDHHKIKNPNPGLSPEERSFFEGARERYWQREWDSGRFNGLPK